MPAPHRKTSAQHAPEGGRGPRPGELVLSAGAAAALRSGHPWVDREQIRGPVERHRPGDVATLVDGRGEVLGWGIVDPASPIAVRVWSRREPKPNADARTAMGEILRERLTKAVVLRDRMIGADTTAYRMVHGEGDRAPGIVVDRYGDVAVVRLDGEAIAAWSEVVFDELEALLRPRGVRSFLLRDPTRGATTKAHLVRGAEIPSRLVVSEHGVPYVVDVLHGQKTGAFLDQRENRREVGRLSTGRRVLNLFSYTGGFSLHAVLGGATHCTSVDVASAAHATAQESFRAAKVDVSAHAFVSADVFDFLARAASRGERWDLVISDPPNMAPRAAAKSKALVAYRKLHQLAVSVLAEGGIFCAASCSSHVGLEDFLTTLGDDVLVRDDLRIVSVHGAAADHPVLPAFPEGRYLEFIVLR